MLQSRQHRLRCEELHAGGGELDREWQPVEVEDDRGDRRRVLRGHHEVWLHRACTFDEQPDRIGLGEHLERRQPFGIGEVERRDRELLLARDAERRTARGHDLQAGRRAEQRRDRRGRGEDLLEVVEYEEQGLVAQVLGHAVDRELAAADLHAEGVGDGRGHELRIGDRRERYPERAVDDEFRENLHRVGDDEEHREHGLDGG